MRANSRGGWMDGWREEGEEGGGLLSGSFLLVSSLPLKWEMRDESFTAVSPPC